MNNSERKQVISLLKTVKSAIEHAKNNMVQSVLLINDSCDALNSISAFLNEKEPEYNTEYILELIKRLKGYNNLDINSKKQLLIYSDKAIEKIIKNLVNVKKKTKIKALFLPYKASMWTSLESVWKAANEDENCETVVMPIPYHDLDNQHNKIKIHYEGEEYPSYVPIRKFWEYDIAEERPDVIFIHNPYDDTNTLTRIPDEYYSRNLKKYTDMLVYIPYHTTYKYNMNKDDILFNTNSIVRRYADKIIVENDDVKEKYEQVSNYGDVLALGSPKFDAIYNMRKDGFEGVEKWKECISNKKVFLLTTTLSFYTRKKKQALEIILKIYSDIVRRDDCVLIWRPHPLEESWIRNSIPELFNVYQEVKENFIKYTNTFIDSSEEYRTVLFIADAVFTTHTSLVNEFMAMGKPVYIIEETINTAGTKSLINDKYNYHLEDKDINEYMEDVLNGNEDALYSKRIEAFNESVKNAVDGSCGKEVYKTIKNELEKIL